MNDLESAVARHMQELARWAAGVEFHDLPAAVLRKAALVIADDVAAMVGARDEPEIRAYHEGVLARAQRREATVFRGGGLRADRYSAAVANALAGDWLELDEGYRMLSCHAGLYVVPALLAEAEADNVPVHEVLRAVAIGYEVVTRMARAFTPADETIHSHANYSAIGASAAIASVRRLEAPAFLDALSAACTYCVAGPRSHVIKGALVRNTWPAVGAWSGMMSVDWAQCGIGGLAESAYDALAGALHATPHPERLTAALGAEWAILDGYTKVYACCQHAHSAVEATLAVREPLLRKSTLDNIDEITVEAHALAMKLCNADPATTLAAKFSMPHIVAAVLTFGNAGARAFYSDTLAHAGIAALRQRVRLTAYARALEPPNDRPARVALRLRDGSLLAAECLSAAGGPDRPFGDDALMAKIGELTSQPYPRFAVVMRGIIGLEPQQLARGWREVVAAFCEPPTRA
jgi:2-methylcitrate dehydratase PrpD